MCALPIESKRAAEFGWPGGDRPGELAFREPVAEEVRSAIFGVLAPQFPAIEPNAELMALTPPEGAIGRFRLRLANHKTAFVRVSARWGHPKLEQAITAFLQSHGLAVNHLEVAGLPLSFGGQILRVDTRDLLQGSHFDGSSSKLDSLARALALCHLLLRSFPEASAVREHAAERFEGFGLMGEQIRQALVEKRWRFFSEEIEWAQANERWLSQMAECYTPRLDLLPASQCLHAQVHCANVLYRLPDAHPVLLDFEEAVQTFAPVSWDLAYFVQRFCLFDQPSLEALHGRLRIVREAYGAPAPGLAEMMRQTAWFSMAVLIDYQKRGIVSPLGEYQKFVRLEEQAGQLAALLGQYFDV